MILAHPLTPALVIGPCPRSPARDWLMLGRGPHVRGLALGLGVLLTTSPLVAQPLAVDPNDPAAVIGGRPDRPSEPLPAARQVAPLTTSLTLNDVPIDHRTAWDLSLGAVGGDGRNTSPVARGTVRLQGELRERKEDNLYLREQEGWYGQVISFNRVRDITLTETAPVDVIGFRLRYSLTGTCALPGHAEGTYCTYTPGLSVDPNSLDPDLLLPTRFVNDSYFGTEVDAADLDAIRQPGWQRGAPGGMKIGLDLDIPNSGYVPNAARRGEARMTRRENDEIGGVLALSKVRQQLMSNDQGAVLSRTIRGLALPSDHDWNERTLGWQALAWLLPALKADLQANEDKAYPRINNNLFLAANNVRRPADSLTLYESGVGRVVHAKGAVTRFADVPWATYNAIWLGLSPVVNRVQTNRLRLQTLGPRATTSSTFNQGGDEDALSQMADVTQITSLGGITSQLDVHLLQDPFLQLGLDFTIQAANLIRTSELVETTRYVPNFSLTGTWTGAEQVLRYFAGAMEGEDPDNFRVNGYLGGDWTYNGGNGWRAQLGAIGYTEPNYDYFSEARGSLAKSLQLPKDTKLTLGAFASHAFDRPGDYENFVLDYDASRLDLSARVERGGLSLSLIQGLDQVLPDSRAQSTTLGFSYRVSPRLDLSGLYTPTSKQTSYVVGQAGIGWRPFDHSTNPTLRLQWTRIKYNWYENIYRDELSTTEDVLMLVFKMNINDA